MEGDFLPTEHTEIADALFQNVHPPNEAATTAPGKPKVALLTQTIVPCPAIQFVLPARIRTRLQNDVVFVGERSLVLREIVMGSYLEDVSVNSDFDANIMAIKAVRLQSDVPLDVQMRLGVQEDPSSATYTEDNLPDHLLVLTLDSKELIFLYYRDGSSIDKGGFSHFRRPLPSDVSIVERFGRHLAVDPKSRAIAVAASANFFGVFLLRSSEDLLSQIKVQSLNPILEERFFRLDGDILFMEFLYPEPDNENKIILLLVISKGSETLAVAYDWDSADTLRQARPKVVVKKLPDACRLPSMIIPLTKSTSFLIVTTSFLIMANHFTSANMKYSRRLPLSEISVKLPKTWANWTRPYRHQRYNKSHDDIYLCREDGVILYVNISSNGLIDGVHSLGSVGCDVDGAFDTIDFSDPSHGGDLLIAAGNTGNGGLFISEPRQNPTCVQKFENWGPVLDTVLVPPSQRSSQFEHNPRAYMKENGRLYACSSAAGGRGAVSEFRYGYEAQIGWIVSLDELSSVGSIWCIPDSSEGGTYLLVSDPVMSTLLYIPRSNGGEIYAIDEMNSALDASTQTLAAGYTPGGVLVQVTSHSIRLAVTENPSMKDVFRFEDGQVVIISTVNGPLGLLAVALRSGHNIAIKIRKITLFEGSFNCDHLGSTVEFNEEPTSLLIEKINNEIFLFVASGDGHIDCYQPLDFETRFIGRYTLSLDSDDVLKVIDSMSIITWPETHHASVFCGLRSGILVPMDIYFNMVGSYNRLDTTQHPYVRLGQTVVKLSKKDRCVLATCGSGFWYVSDVEENDASNCNVNEIWITDQDDPGYVQKSIDVFTTVEAPHKTSSTSLDGSLICISGGQLLICTLERRAKAVPRRIEVPGGANRIEYSQYLRCLIVAYTSIEMSNLPGTGISERRARPCLDFIDIETHNSLLSSQQELHHIEASKSWRPSGSPGEKITCILDWTPEHDGQKYHFVVIGTARRTQDNKGRVIFLHTRRNAVHPDRIECSMKYIHVFDGPVRAIAAYGDCTLMVAAGNDIIPLEPDMPNRRKRWAPSARFKLTSPGVSITVCDTFLYISTARESLVILHVVENRLELFAHDGARYECLSHYHIGGEYKLVLASTRGGRLSLFSETGITNTDKLLTPAVAEANLPISIIRLSPCAAHPLLPTSSIMHGVTMDGTIYRIMTINEKEWQLLRFVQNLCGRDPIISPFLSARKRRWTWTDIMPQSRKPSQMHVDGDLLSRLVCHGATHLQKMLDGDDTKHLQSNASAALPLRTCREVFEEMFREVFGEDSSHEDSISQFMRWLQRLLRPYI